MNVLIALKTLWQKQKKLILRHCFQKLSAVGASESLCMWKRFKQITASLSGQNRHCFSDWLNTGRTSLNPFPHIDAFWRLCSRRLLKTLWQEEKYHIISFFFCHDFFNFIQLLYFRLHIFVKVLSRCLKSRLFQICCLFDYFLLYAPFNNRPVLSRRFQVTTGPFILIPASET